MIEEGVALLHRVLIVAEGWQAGGDEVIERLQRILARHGPAEGFEIAEVIGKPGLHQCHHLARDGVRLEAQRLGGITSFGSALRLSWSKFH